MDQIETYVLQCCWLFWDVSEKYIETNFLSEIPGADFNSFLICFPTYSKDSKGSDRLSGSIGLKNVNGIKNEIFNDIL